jgi:hypothetical protein
MHTPRQTPYLTRCPSSLCMLIVTLSVVFWGCAGKATRSKSADENLTLLYTSSRFLELEPCGCSFNPTGGIDRQWEIENGWLQSESTRTFLRLTAGTTFMPQGDKAFKPGMEAFHLQKAHYLVKAFNELGLNALSPSAYDLALGEQKLAALQKASRFEWTSANIYKNGKPAFAPFWKWESGGRSILVVGATPVDPEARAAGFEVRDPIPLIQDIVAAQSGPKTMVVLISTFSTQQRQATLRAVPRINLALGARIPEETNQILQTSPTQLFGNPVNEGRAIARLDLDWPKGALMEFNNPAFVAAFQEQIAQLEMKLRKAKKSEKGKIQSELDLARLLSKDRPKAIQFKSRFESVTQQYENPQNPAGKVLQKYRQSVHELALNSAP